MKIKVSTMTISVLMVFTLSFGYCLTKKELIRSFWAMTAGDVDKETQKKIDDFDNSIKPLSFKGIFDSILSPFSSQR
ncbi:Uncharacterised protein [Citrobacter freundii]|nr:Uncharacterised protein [Citrobacter freundii]